MSSHTSRISIIVIFIIVILLVGGLYITFRKDTDNNTIKALFTCNGGKTIQATFFPQDDIQVNLQLSDGRKVALPHAISASGARYATPDESMVFWNKGNTAFITENGTTTFENCVTQQ